MVPDAPVGALVVVAILGIVTAAALSAGEAALGRLTRTAAAELVASGRRGAAGVQRLAGNPWRAASAAGFMRGVAETTAAVCVTLAVAAWLSVWWQVLGISIALTLVALVVVVWVSPRSIGRHHPAEVLSVLAPPMLALSWLAVPFERAVVASRAGRTAREEDAEAAEERRDMVDRVSESERIEEDEREMLQSVFELGRTLTREVMVPRTAMVTLSADATAARALSLFVRSGYSRVPVIGESVDDVLGVLYLKDVLRRVQPKAGDGSVQVSELVREPVFVPETKPVDDLMREMQQSASHIALVVDEYGGIAGLVTIEDALEEIVGELRDEHDRAEPKVTQLGNGVLRVPATLPIDELGDLFGLELSDDEVDTTGGLLAKTIGRVPIPGASVETHGLHIQAERAQGRRRQVASYLVRRVAVAGPAEESAERDVEDPARQRDTGPRRSGEPTGGRT
jgi:CBS domain containing-hemolysin-like protein